MTPANPHRLDELYRDAYLMATIAADQSRAELDQVCQKFHISIAQYPVLWVLCLSNEKDGVPMSEVADGLVTRAADTTRLVDRLIDSGLVSRRQSSDDRRKVLVQATAKGRKVFEEVTVEIKSVHRKQFSSLSYDEVKMLIRLLNKLVWRQGGEA
ncbi:MAG: MarR family transcriptional regulator [Acidimicrobiales bacterium]